jgi:ABC-2 type transport system ATP-binding protein
MGTVDPEGTSRHSLRGSSSPPARLLACEQVSLSYDGLRHAVCDLSFTVDAGSIFALVGPNGAGKTSTLRMLATLIEPTMGTIAVDGVDPQRDREGARRRIGYLPDNFALYDHMTPVEYLAFFARAYGIDARTRARRIDALLDEFDLAQKRSSAIRTLSRGMRQRLGIAKTLVHDPKVVLLDEPASALDPGARLKLREALMRLKRRGLAVLISSHILPDLAGLADAVGIMESGRLLHAGPIDAIAAEHARVVYRIEVRLADRARRALADFGSRVVACEEPEPGVFEVTLDGGADAIADLADALVLRGARLVHVAPRESALEAVYRQSQAAQVA